MHFLLVYFATSMERSRSCDVTLLYQAIDFFSIKRTVFRPAKRFAHLITGHSVVPQLSELHLCWVYLNIASLYCLRNESATRDRGHPNEILEFYS